MEPALHDGDILIVQKSDIYSHRLWNKWTSSATPYEEEGEYQSAIRLMALDSQSGRPIGYWQTGYTYLNPPMIYQLGLIIVFRAPDAEKYPSSEYRVKRAAGLGGQICRASDNFHSIERMPPYSLWVEGDNQDSNKDKRSFDSRTYGPVCKNNVIGIAERIVWPPTRWGVVTCVTPPVPQYWWE